MRLVELSLPTPEENLALDEALVDEAEVSTPAIETLRLWESPTPLVVVCRGAHVAREVNEEFCRERRIPILRRTSGGAAIVAGPGCLMYAVVLSYEARPAPCALTRRLGDTLSPRERGIAPQFRRRLTLARRERDGSPERVRR